MATVHWHDSVRPIGNFFFQVGIAPEWEQRYFETYLPLNPLQPFQVFCPVEEVHAGSEFMSFDEFSQTRFYKEWAAPQGLVDAAFSNLERMSTTAVAMSIMRGKQHGLIDDEARRRMKLIVPHVRRAALISKAIDQTRIQAATLTTATDALAAGMFLLDIAGRIIGVNAAGAAMIENGPVKLVNGVLRLLEREPDRIFQEAAAASGDPVELRSKAVALPIIAANKQNFILHMLPLDRNRRVRLGADQEAALLVFVRRLDGAGAANLAALATRFGLTKQEARVLGAVVDTGSVPTAADLLGISTTTARTHVNSLFNKTGVHSQAGLVRLLIESESPFRGP